MIILQNPGLIDIEVIKNMGINVKPKDNSIGYFGTGLKYAIATFLRNNIELCMWIGEQEYVFYTEKMTIRDQEFDMCRMKGPVDSTPLGFTTELGKNWAVWQAYREIHSNCLDEDGNIYSINGVHTKGRAECTTFCVDPKEDVSGVFLCGDRKREDFMYSDGNVEIYAGKSNHIFYRGIRSKDLFDESIYTYNILSECTLTEDRLLCYDFQVEEIVNNAVAKMDDPETIGSIVGANDGTFEGTLQMHHSTTVEPSEVFQRVVGERIMGRAKVTHGAEVYAEKFKPKETKTPGEIRSEFMVLLEELCDDNDVALSKNITPGGTEVYLTGGVLNVSGVVDNYDDNVAF